MKYVGATNNFIRGPFIVEGVIIGVVSALITLGAVSLSYNGIMSQVLTSSVLQKVQISLYSFSELFVKILFVYIVLGIGIGIVGSIISMRKYLKV
jgi:cell division transport system permease protein